MKEYNAKYYAEHREELRAYQKQWKAENPEAMERQRDHNREYYRAHRAEHAATGAKWRAEHPERIRELDAKRRAEHPEKQREATARWRTSHLEQSRAIVAKCRIEHLEERRAYDVRHRLENIDRERAGDAAYARENPERMALKTRRRRAIKRNAPVNDFTLEQWQERKAEYGYHCAYCLKPSERLTMDHMTPLSRGGSHTLSNIVPACLSCNCKKHTKMLLEYVMLTGGKL